MIRRLFVVVVLFSLLLTGCGGSEAESGPGLATVPARPTNTPAPAVAALPQQAALEFFGTTAGFRYPADWTTYREANYIVAMPELPEDDTAPQDGMFVQRPTHPQVGVTVLLESNAERAYPLWQAARLYFFALDHTGGRFFTDYGSVFSVAGVPDSRHETAFTWGEYEAAAFTHVIDAGGTAFESAHVAVQVAENRFVVWWVTGYEWNWAELAPHAAAILATATLDGAPLPAADLNAALAAILAGPDSDVQATLDADPSVTPFVRPTLVEFDDATGATATAAPE